MIQIPENISTLSALCALQDTDLLSSIPGRQSNNKRSGGGGALLSWNGCSPQNQRGLWEPLCVRQHPFEF